MARKTFEQRVKTTFASMKQRAKKYGDTVEFTAAELLSLVVNNTHCRWCRVKITPATLNFDHKQPAARGGTWTLANMEPICGGCNRKKGALTEQEFDFLKRALKRITELTGDEYAEKNILKRLAAGGAFIYG
jgi:5-methylcytosine-specific restriction endonuclease McrA